MYTLSAVHPDVFSDALPPDKYVYLRIIISSPGLYAVCMYKR